MASVLSHDLNEEMVASLGKECDPQPAIAAFVAQVGSRKDADTVEAAGREVFGAFGARLMQRALALGEQYTDQTYEVLKEAVRRTGRLTFPHVAQRFLEIAYLATQPVSTVDIVENNHYRLINRMGPYCEIYKGVKAACGDEVAGQLPCRHACLNAMQTLYDGLRLDVTVSQEAKMGNEGECRFAASNNRPLEPTPWKR